MIVPTAHRADADVEMLAGIVQGLEREMHAGPTGAAVYELLRRAGDPWAMIVRRRLHTYPQPRRSLPPLALNSHRCCRNAHHLRAYLLISRHSMIPLREPKPLGAAGAKRKLNWPISLQIHSAMVATPSSKQGQA